MKTNTLVNKELYFKLNSNENKEQKYTVNLAKYYCSLNKKKNTLIFLFLTRKEVSKELREIGLVAKYRIRGCKEF